LRPSPQKKQKAQNVQSTDKQKGRFLTVLFLFGDRIHASGTLKMRRQEPTHEKYEAPLSSNKIYT